MPQVLPSDTGTACFRVDFNTGGGDVLNSHYLQINMLATGTFPPGTTYVQHLLAVWNAFRFPAFTALPNSPWMNGFQATYNLTSGVWADNEGGSWDGGGPPPPIVMANGIWIYLQTARNDKSGTGRLHWPFTQPSDFTNGRVNGSFLPRVTPWLNWWLTPKTYLGVHLQPVVWSRKLGIYSPITHATVGTLPGYLRARRYLHTRRSLPIAYFRAKFV